MAIPADLNLLPETFDASLLAKLDPRDNKAFYDYVASFPSNWKSSIKAQACEDRLARLISLREHAEVKASFTEPTPATVSVSSVPVSTPFEAQLLNFRKYRISQLEDFRVWLMDFEAHLETYAFPRDRIPFIKHFIPENVGIPLPVPNWPELKLHLCQTLSKYSSEPEWDQHVLEGIHTSLSNFKSGAPAVGNFLDRQFYRLYDRSKLSFNVLRFWLDDVVGMTEIVNAYMSLTTTSHSGAPGAPPSVAGLILYLRRRAARETADRATVQTPKARRSSKGPQRSRGQRYNHSSKTKISADTNTPLDDMVSGTHPESSSDTDGANIKSVTNDTPFGVELCFGRNPLPQLAMHDSGAVVNMIPKALLDFLGFSTTLVEDSSSVVSITGERIPVVGTAALPISIGSDSMSSCVLEFSVTDHPSFADLIVGRPGIRQIGLDTVVGSSSFKIGPQLFPILPHGPEAYIETSLFHFSSGLRCRKSVWQMSVTAPLA